jgi:tetratricopeptide (TPR) repeat protein
MNWLRRAPFLLGAAWLAVAPVARALDEAGPSSAASTSEGDSLSSSELARMLEGLSHESVDDRRAAADSLASLGPEATVAIGAKLADLRREADDGAYTVVRAVREHASKDPSFDLVQALVVLKPDPSVRHALATACLVRALTHAGTTPAVRQLILVVPDIEGVFRPELTRQIKVLGDRAVAGLIEARRNPTPETRTWAANMLDLLGKRTPGDAVQTKDNQVLSDVLRAYASVKDLDALAVVLSFVNSDRVQVRTAARESTLAYGQDAVWRLREAYAALTGDQAPEGISAADLAKKLFDAYDRYRLRDVYALVDEGLVAQRDGKLKDAVEAFDGALARQPMLDRRNEMAPAYAAYGESLEPEDRAAALGYLRKALRVDEAGPVSSHVRSEIHYLEGEDLLARGIADTEPFEQAIALDPKNSRAQAELDRLRAQSASNRARVWQLLGAGALIVLALAGIAVVGGKRGLRRPKIGW